MLIQLAKSDAQILSCFPTLYQLRPHLEQKDFLAQVHRQQQDGYELVFVDIGSHVAAVAGFRISECLDYRHFIYLDDLVVDETVRSQKYGQRLFDWLIEYAKLH
ncbi:MAG: GNAT family N-acetyltransferase, partial [Cyanobacteria bacterium CAN_BIN43]|nr:GNAT family N-acetyltransferase [Cyanobacteria bacterium CAN_BIN43]